MHFIKLTFITSSKLKLLMVAILLATTMTVFCWGNLPGIASAHAELKSATIGPNAVVNQAPALITLVFGEESDLKQTVIQVRDVNGGDVTSGPATPKAGDATTWTINLKQNLPNGTYTVKYHTLTDDDGGIVDGSYTFKIASSVTSATGSAAIPNNVPATGEGGATIDNSSATLLSLLTWLLLLLLVASVVLIVRRKYRD